MRRRVHGWTALALVFTAAGPARADLIFSHQFNQGGGGQAIHADAIYFSFTPFPNGTTESPLLFDLRLTPADIGKTFVADPTTPHFAATADLLTNGRNDRVFLAAGPMRNTQPEGGFEDGFFYNVPINPNGPATTGRLDLKGGRIDRVTFTVTDLVMTSPGTDPNGDGLWTDYRLKGVLTFEGQAPDWWQTPPDGGAGEPAETPEPATLTLALVGLFGAAYRRARRRVPGTR